MRHIAPLLLSLAACSNPTFSENRCADIESTSCVEVDPADTTQDLLDIVNSVESGATVILGAGTFSMENQVTFRGADNIALIGQGMDETNLDFGAMEVQANGVDAIGDDFLIQDLTITDAPKDGLRVEDSEGVTIRRVRATWTNENDPTNGGYGLYPVRVSKVLIEDSEAFNASDAGIYVGQCIDAVVRRNTAKKNVAGLEIENTQYADVYENIVQDNTGGLVVFDLPGNPVIGRDVKIHNNTITDNNRANFAPGGTVAQIPAGTGTFALASRRVEITGNTYANNNTGDVALLSGLVIDGNPEKWAIPNADLIGDTAGLMLDEGDGVTMNFRTSEVYIHGNTHSGSGKKPDNSDMNAREIGFLLAVAYSGQDVDNVLYDSIGESSFDAEDASLNSNDHHICVNSDVGSFSSMDLENLAARPVPLAKYMYRPDAPFAPFDCDSFTEGPLVMPTFLDE